MAIKKPVRDSVIPIQRMAKSEPKTTAKAVKKLTSKAVLDLIPA